MNSNTDIHKKLGFKILAKEDVQNQRTKRPNVDWPKDEPFEPKGVTYEEAKEAMKKI